MATGVRVAVRYFAALREGIGSEGETLTLPEPATVASARALIAERHPAIAPVLARCVPALNRVFASDTAPLADGDELVFIPPMAGG